MMIRSMLKHMMNNKVRTGRIDEKGVTRKGEKWRSQKWKRGKEKGRGSKEGRGRESEEQCGILVG